MDLSPILSTLRRHKTAAGLIVIEIAIATAIVCNALHLIHNRIELLTQDSGLPEAELIDLEVLNALPMANGDDLTRQDLEAIRALPGVKNAAAVDQVIYGDNNSNTGVRLDPDPYSPQVSASQYEGGPGVLATMGLKLIAGRDFLPEEYRLRTDTAKEQDPRVPAVMVNRELAQRLWPGQPAVGKQIYAYGKIPSTVVGVVERLTHPYPGHAENSEGFSILGPVAPTYRGGAYLVRVDPAQRDAVMRALPGVIEHVEPSRIVQHVRTMTEMRRAYFAQDRSMVWLMGGVCVLLLVVTAFGIVGLASFWVQQRKRMIGTRRALGATRRQIQHYFQLENFLLTSAGIAIGMAAAYGGSLVLMQHYQLPRLPWSYLPLGALALWTLGQLAVLAPARRAAALPPVVVMRGA
jgi:putative ABC transport system permease protein